VEKGGLMRQQQPGLVRAALALALLLLALSFVIWRQSRALEGLRSLDQLRAQLALNTAERGKLAIRIQRLESRGRIVADARTRLGLRVPVADEIVILPLRDVESERGPVRLARSFTGATP
jgi:hypothetical protein